MFSKTCEYAIRAMIFVAQQSKDGRKTNVKEISRGIDSPEFFIGKILQDLSRKGLIQSTKGINGGFHLDKRSMKSSIADIVKAVDGDKLFSGCGIGLSQCSEAKPCPIHHEFKQLRKNIFDMLDKARLNELHEQLVNNMAFLKQR